MPTYEGLRLKIQKYWRKGLASYRHNKLERTDFTIIANNCWGGMVYEAHGLSKESPTIGMFFMADDYIKLLTHLKEYLAADLTFIKPEDSRWKNAEAVRRDKRYGSYPVGKLQIAIGGGTENGVINESIEIFFLHYQSEEEAKNKWERRIKRINWNHLLVKFNDQNDCTEEHIKTFDTFPFKNKVCFTVKKYPQYKSVVQIKSPRSHKFIRASYEPFGKSRYIDVTQLLCRL